MTTATRSDFISAIMGSAATRIPDRTQSHVPDQITRHSRNEKPCGLLRRLLIMLYDGLVVVAILMLATAIAMAFGMENRTAGKDPFYTAGLLLVWFLYFGWSWSRGGVTVGMRAWRVRIENDAGENPGWGQSAVRFLVAWPSAAAAGLGFIWSLFRADRKTWHDLASHTRLVQQYRPKRNAAK